MVMLAEPLERALAAIRAARAEAAPAPLVLFTPTGRPHRPGAWCASSRPAPGAVLLCGRYEGIDQRFIDRHVDVELSLGDFVLSGGELPALALLDAVARLQPGVLGDAAVAPAGQLRRRPARLPALQPPGGLADGDGERRCRRCCCRATTPRSHAGGASDRSSSPRAAGPT